MMEQGASGSVIRRHSLSHFQTGQSDWLFGGQQTPSCPFMTTASSVSCNGRSGSPDNLSFLHCKWRINLSPKMFNVINVTLCREIEGLHKRPRISHVPDHHLCFMTCLLPCGVSPFPLHHRSCRGLRGGLSTPSNWTPPSLGGDVTLICCKGENIYMSSHLRVNPARLTKEPPSGRLAFLKLC